MSEKPSGEQTEAVADGVKQAEEEEQQPSAGTQETAAAGTEEQVANEGSAGEAQEAQKSVEEHQSNKEETRADEKAAETQEPAVQEEEKSEQVLVDKEESPTEGVSEQIVVETVTESEAETPAELPNSQPEELPNEEDEGRQKDPETATDATAESLAEDKHSSSTPIVSASKKTRPPYKYDPNKITLRFLFANRDGLTVTVECNPSDTVGEVKGALISVWPKDMPTCDGGDNLRLICMGKGYLMPDTRTLEDCQIPVFKTHPTPINVSVKPKEETAQDLKHKKHHDSGGLRGASNTSSNAARVGQGCACVIL